MRTVNRCSSCPHWTPTLRRCSKWNVPLTTRGNTKWCSPLGRLYVGDTTPEYQTLKLPLDKSNQKKLQLKKIRTRKQTKITPKRCRLNYLKISLPFSKKKSPKSKKKRIKSRRRSKKQLKKKRSSPLNNNRKNKLQRQSRAASQLKQLRKKD